MEEDPAYKKQATRANVCLWVAILLPPQPFYFLHLKNFPVFVGLLIYFFLCLILVVAYCVQKKKLDAKIEAYRRDHPGDWLKLLLASVQKEKTL